MTGWPAVAATTGLMTLALVSFNIRLYRRMRTVLAAAKRDGNGGEPAAGETCT